MLAKWAKQAPGQGEVHHQGLSDRARSATDRRAGSAPVACEAAVAVRLAREKGKAEAMEDWLFANQPALTPDTVKKAAATVGGVTDFDARFAGHARTGEGRHRAGRAVEGHRHADVLHERHSPARAARRVLRRRDRLGAEAGCQAASRDVACRLRSRPKDLTKDFLVGFWRPRPYRALDALTLQRRGWRGLRFSRPERRRQEHDAEAADAAAVPDQRVRAHPGPSRRRRRGAPAHRLSRRESRITTITSPPKSCCRTSRGCSATPAPTSRHARRARAG